MSRTGINTPEHRQHMADLERTLNEQRRAAAHHDACLCVGCERAAALRAAKERVVEAALKCEESGSVFGSSYSSTRDLGIACAALHALRAESQDAGAGGG